MIGRTLSHYRIVAPLDSGGMGVVWRARDLHLDRDVALKVLPEGALADEIARKRFRREALALSRLNHAHIATVFDFDTKDGVDFLVMELVAGEPLSQRMARGALAEHDVRALGAQIAGALEAAHEQGIVHRDLKPANVMVSAKGEIKVLDFGLARLVRPLEGLDLTRSLTEAEVAVGTVPYMAPEQLLARSVDGRADIYALGVILYEMVTGRSPYSERAPTALIYEIVNGSVPPPRTAAPGASEQLEALILRCLAKEPEQRYPSARDLAGDLREAGRAVAVPPPSPRPSDHARPPGSVIAATVAGLAVVSIALALLLDVGGLRDRLTSSLGHGAIRALAVLPLENLSRDPEQAYFAEGMTDELITNLAKISALRVISRTSAMRFRGSKASVPQIARELRVDAVVVGSVQRSADHVRIRMQLVRAANERSLWAESYERPLRDALSLEVEVARAIANEIRVHVTPGEHARLQTARPVDPAVSEAYLRGRFHASRYTREDGDKAIQQFTRATELDPTYAPAYAGLATTYCVGSASSFDPSDAMPKAKAASQRALALDPGLAEAHACLGYVTAFYDWRWRDAEQEFQRAIELAPGDATAHLWFGYYLMYTKRFDRSRMEIRKAWEIDPLSPLAAMMQLWPLLSGRRYDEAIQEGHRLLASDSSLTNSYLIVAQAYTMKGEFAKARATLHEGMRRDSPNNQMLLAWLGYGYARAGRRDSARIVMERILNLSSRGYFDPYPVAVLYAGMDERDRAFEWLERSIAGRTENAAYSAIDPGMDPLRADPRFADVLRRVGFGPVAAAKR